MSPTSTVLNSMKIVQGIRVSCKASSLVATRPCHSRPLFQRKSVSFKCHLFLVFLIHALMIQCIYGMTPYTLSKLNSRNSLQDGQSMKHSRDETHEKARITKERQSLPVMDHRSASIYVTFHRNETMSRPIGYDVEYQVQIKEVRRLSNSHSFFSNEEKGYQYQPLSETKSIWTWSDSSQDVLQHAFTKRLLWNIPIQSCVNSEGTVIAYSHCEEMYYIKLWRVAKAFDGKDGNDDLKLMRYAFVERKYLDTSPLYVHLHVALEESMKGTEETVSKMTKGRESASVSSMPIDAHLAVENSHEKDTALETYSVKKSEKLEHKSPYHDHVQTSNFKEIGMMRGSRLGQTSPRAATIDTKTKDTDSNAAEWAVLVSLLGLTVSFFSMIHVMSQKKSEERDHSIVIDVGIARTPNDNESVPVEVVRQNVTNIVSPIHTPSSPLRRNTSKNVDFDPLSRKLDEVSQSSKHEMNADNDVDGESHCEKPWRRILDEQVQISDTCINEGDATDKTLFSPPFMKRLEKPNSPLFQDSPNLLESSKLSFDCKSPKKDATKRKVSSYDSSSGTNATDAKISADQPVLEKRVTTHELVSSPQAEIGSSNFSKNAVNMKDHQPWTISNQSQKSIEALVYKDETDQSGESCKNNIETEANEDVLISKPMLSAKNTPDPMDRTVFEEEKDEIQKDDHSLGESSSCLPNESKASPLLNDGLDHYQSFHQEQESSDASIDKDTATMDNSVFEEEKDEIQKDDRGLDETSRSLPNEFNASPLLNDGLDHSQSSHQEQGSSDVSIDKDTTAVCHANNADQDCLDTVGSKEEANEKDIDSSFCLQGLRFNHTLRNQGDIYEDVVSEKAGNIHSCHNLASASEMLCSLSEFQLATVTRKEQEATSAFHSNSLHFLNSKTTGAGDNVHTTSKEVLQGDKLIPSPSVNLESVNQILCDLQDSILVLSSPDRNKTTNADLPSETKYEKDTEFSCGGKVCRRADSNDKIFEYSSSHKDVDSVDQPLLSPLKRKYDELDSRTLDDMKDVAENAGFSHSDGSDVCSSNASHSPGWSLSSGKRLKRLEYLTQDDELQEETNTACAIGILRSRIQMEDVDDFPKPLNATLDTKRSIAMDVNDQRSSKEEPSQQSMDHIRELHQDTPDSSKNRNASIFFDVATKADFFNTSTNDDSRKDASDEERSANPLQRISQEIIAPVWVMGQTSPKAKRKRTEPSPERKIKQKVTSTKRSLKDKVLQDVSNHVQDGSIIGSRRSKSSKLASTSKGSKSSAALSKRRHRRKKIASKIPTEIMLVESNDTTSMSKSKQLNPNHFESNSVSFRDDKSKSTCSSSRVY